MPRFDRLEFDEEPGEGSDVLRPAHESGQDERQWLRKADDHRRRGLYENALRYYSRALELDKSLVAGWLGQVQMLLQLGEDAEADLWARKSLELFRGQGDLMAGRASARPDRRPEAGAGALRRGIEAGGALGLPLDGPRRDPDHLQGGDRPPLLRQGGPGRPRLARPPGDRPHLPGPPPAEQGALAGPPGRREGPESFYCWYVQGRCEQELALGRQAEQSFRRCLELARSTSRRPDASTNCPRSRGC
ncbi:MAG: tetratricopeptide repeat protein [Singulisphaera sp.]